MHKKWGTQVIQSWVILSHWYQPLCLMLSLAERIIIIKTDSFMWKHLSYQLCLPVRLSTWAHTLRAKFQEERWVWEEKWSQQQTASKRRLHLSACEALRFVLTVLEPEVILLGQQQQKKKRWRIIFEIQPDKKNKKKRNHKPNFHSRKYWWGC